MPIEFDSQALLQILHWAQDKTATAQPQWRQQSPYELARQQAKWSGTPSPDLEVEKQLRLIQARKQKDPGASMLAETAKFAEQIMQGRDEFLGWAVPHLRAYLPAGTPIRATVALAAFLPNYAFSMNETIVVSITDSFWARSLDRFFNLLVHELFHNGFIRYQRGVSPSDAADGAALRRTLLWSIQNEGLATYIAFRAKPAQLILDDYRLIENQEEVRKRFDLCRRLMLDLERTTREELPSLRNDCGVRVIP